jgi:superfamily II DNA/RNA helicase
MQRFVRTSQSAPKPLLLLDLLKQSVVAGDKKILIFCNTRASAEWVYEWIKGKGYTSSYLVTGESDAKERHAILQSFSQVSERSSNDEFENQSGSEKPTILVCTDVASRGVDMTALNHVVLFDFPVTAIDYLHRAGRVGRAGSVVRGRVTSLLDKKEVRLAETIERAIKMGLPLA